jgi:site-specific recombinase XerD
MSKKPISPLRQRLIDDMTARRFSEDTKRDYVRNVRKFAAFLGRSPDTATSEDLRRFQLHMAQQQVSPSTINAAIAALRFFFTVTLEKPDLVRPLRTVTKPRKAPVVLSQEEVARLLQAAPSLKYKARTGFHRRAKPGAAAARVARPRSPSARQPRQLPLCEDFA